MNEDERSNELPISEADTTPPNPANAAVPSPSGSGWQMPEPKFQQSSGYLPQGYLDKVAFEAPPPSNVSPAAAGPAAAPAASAGPDVEPQPDLSEQLIQTPEPSVSQPPRAERSGAARIALIVLGLLAMIAFIAIFLGAVYYLFLSPQSGNTTF
jgi:hypothetical protein